MFGQGKAFPIPQPRSYQDYKTAGYQQINIEQNDDRNIFVVVGIAALIEAHNNQHYFQTIFTRLFGEEPEIQAHCESVRVFLETRYTEGKGGSDLPWLMEVWRERVLKRLQVDIREQEAKTQAGPAAKNDAPDDHALFLVMQKLLHVRIVVFSQELIKDDVYTTPLSYSHAIILVEHSPHCYDYLTRNLVLRRATEVKLNKDPIRVVAADIQPSSAPKKLNDSSKEDKLEKSPVSIRDLFSHSKRYRSAKLFDNPRMAYETYRRYLELVKNAKSNAEPLNFLCAAETQSYDVIDLFDRHEKKYVTARNAEGNTALHLAIKILVENHDDLAHVWPTIKILLEFDYLDVNARNSRGQTALNIAMQELQKMEEEKSYLDSSPINMEKQYHLFKAIRALILRIGRDDRLIREIAALPYYSAEFLPWLINEFKPDLNFEVKAPLGESARECTLPFMHMVVGYGHSSVLAQLLQDERLDPNVVDEKGDSPLLRICVSSPILSYIQRQYPDDDSKWFLEPCEKWQVNLAQQLLDCKRTNPNQARKTLEKHGPYHSQYLTPLVAAVLRNDLSLFSLLLGCKQLRLIEDDFVVLFKLLHFLSINSSTLSIVHSALHAEVEDKETRALSHRNITRIASEMIKRLLKRPDLTPIPSVYTADRYREELYLCDYDVYFSLQVDIMLCGDTNIIRRLLLHPRFAKELLQDDARYQKVVDRFSRKQEDEKHSKNVLNIWCARKILETAEVALAKMNFAASEKSFAEVRKNDGALLDIYSRQVLLDTSFRTLYPFQDVHRSQLLKTPAVLCTDDPRLLLFFAQEYEKSALKEDKLFAEGLYGKALERASKNENLPPGEQSLDNMLVRLSVPRNIENRSHHAQPFNPEKLIKTLESNVSWSPSNWGNPLAADAQAILDVLSHARESNNNLHGTCPFCREKLLEKYTELRSRGVESELVTTIEDALLPRVPNVEEVHDVAMTAAAAVNQHAQYIEMRRR